MARELESKLKSSPIKRGILINVIACAALIMGLVLWNASLESAERQGGAFGIYLMVGAGLLIAVDLVVGLIFTSRNKPLWARGFWYGLTVPVFVGIVALVLAFGIMR